MCKTVLLFDWFINVFLLLRTFCNCAKIIFSVTRKGENCTKFSLCDKGRLVTSHSAITGPFVWDINVTVYTRSAPDSNPGLLRLSCLNVWLGAGGSRHRLQGVLEGVPQGVIRGSPTPSQSVEPVAVRSSRSLSHIQALPLQNLKPHVLGCLLISPNLKVTYLIFCPIYQILISHIWAYFACIGKHERCSIGDSQWQIISEITDQGPVLWSC